MSYAIYIIKNDIPSHYIESFYTVAGARRLSFYFADPLIMFSAHKLFCDYPVD